MASVAATVIASMVIDDMLKDDGGAEAIGLMSGDGKVKRTKRRKRKMKKKKIVSQNPIIFRKIGRK